MKPIISLQRISDIGKFDPAIRIMHPLVAIVDFSKIDEYLEEGTRISCDFYTIMFKNYCVNTLRYGRQTYDFQEGSLICIAPKQVVTMDSEIEKKENMMGWGLFFHPDLLRGTSLANKMADYTFFAYETSEALHLSDKEKQTLHDCVQKIQQELHENIDDYSQSLIVSNIELLLNYCTRYYGRQFITRKNSNSGTVAQVEQLLKQYFKTDKAQQEGFPTVKYLADQVRLSANYLSDLLKKETGMSAQDHIHYHVIEAAKNLLLNSDKTVGELSFMLGFEYPQYFSRLFKSKTGLTPLEYRNLN
ncbi:MAG: helix-turn-helix transcriptional regulator [Crocinitomicaceae bacterium]|nr:helix-turn-helix transcriptional regulator [Crocinitomicaceae bacterium]NGF77101.1 helix-turn-helix transcriptional regulator [Fluviicola sp. SGL-29]